MADDSEHNAAGIFATNESRAAAIARAQAGDGACARTLLEFFVERDVYNELAAYVADALWPLLYDRRHNVRVGLSLDPDRKRRPVTTARAPRPTRQQHLLVPLQAHAPSERLLAQWCNDALLCRPLENRFTRSVKRVVCELLAGEKSEVVLAGLGLLGGRISVAMSQSSVHPVLRPTKGRPDEFEELRDEAARLLLEGRSARSVRREVLKLLIHHRWPLRMPSVPRQGWGAWIASERGTANTLIRLARQEMFGLVMTTVLGLREDELDAAAGKGVSLGPVSELLTVAYPSSTRPARESLTREALAFIEECYEIDRQFERITRKDDADVFIAGEKTTWREWAESAKARTGYNDETLLAWVSRVGELVKVEAAAAG